MTASALSACFRKVSGSDGDEWNTATRLEGPFTSHTPRRCLHANVSANDEGLHLAGLTVGSSSLSCLDFWSLHST